MRPQSSSSSSDFAMSRLDFKLFGQPSVAARRALLLDTCVQFIGYCQNQLLLVIKDSRILSASILVIAWRLKVSATLNKIGFIIVLSSFTLERVSNPLEPADCPA